MTSESNGSKWDVKAIRRISVFIFCTLFAAYSTTLCPSVYWLDSGELQAAVPTLGIPHSPSFPSYILSSHMIRYLPWGDIAFRVNFATALAGSSIGVLLFLLALKVFGSTDRLNLLASSFVGLAGTLNPLIWFQNVKAEVYSLNTLWMLGILIFCVDVLDHLHMRQRVFRNACLASLLFGLGTTNHSLLTAHAVPALIIMLVFTYQYLKIREWMVPFHIMLLTFSVYLYLPLRSTRDPWLDIGNPEHWMNFANAVSRKGTYSRFFGNVIDEWIKNWFVYVRLMNDHFFTLFPVLAFGGLIILTVKRRKPLVILLTAVAVNLSITLLNRNFNMNPDTGPAYLMLSTLILMIGFGAVFQTGLCWVTRRVRSRIVCNTLIVCMFMIPIVWTVESFNRSAKFKDLSAGVVARAILDTCPEDSVVFYGMYFNLPFVVSYLQSVENYRTDIVGINRGEIVYWPGGLENVRKRYPWLTESVFNSPYGPIFEHLSARSARHSTMVPYDEARDLLFNASAWMAQDLSDHRQVFWFSSEDDHLLKIPLEPAGPMLRLGWANRPASASLNRDEIIGQRVRYTTDPDFAVSQGARVLAAFYDLQCVTMFHLNKTVALDNAKIWTYRYDPLLASSCEDLIRGK